MANEEEPQQDPKEEQQEVPNSPQEKRSVPIWLFLLPLFVLLAYPLALWVRKLNSPDVELSESQRRAFHTQIEVQRPVELPAEQETAETAYKPPVSSVGLASYGGSEADRPVGVGGQGGGGGASASEDAQQAAKASGGAASGAPSGSKKGYSKMTVDQEKRMDIISRTRGAITDAVGMIMDKNPAFVGMIMNSKTLIDGFTNRATVKPLLNDEKALMNFMMTSPKVNTFLNNEVVKKVLQNEKVMDAIASSKMIDTIIDSPAGKALLNDPDKIQQIATANPQLALMLANPKIAAALMNNPETEGLAGMLAGGGLTGGAAKKK